MVREQVQQEHRENVVERVLKDQVSLVTQKLDSFQENLAAKFLLLEGRVRFLEAALSRVGGKKRPTTAAGVGGKKAPRQRHHPVLI